MRFTAELGIAAPAEAAPVRRLRSLQSEGVVNIRSVSRHDRVSSLEDRLPRKLAVILHADVAGYSRLAGKDEDTTHHRLKASMEVIADLVSEYHGRLIKTAGDAALAMFDAVLDAVSCALAIQSELADSNRNVPEAEQIRFRIGVNLGDVIEDEGDIFGDGVNVAARLERLADPGGICVAEAVYNALGSKLSLQHRDLGLQAVKNIAAPVRAYAVHLRDDEKLPAPSRREVGHRVSAQSGRWPKQILLIAIVLAVAGSLLLWLKPLNDGSEPAGQSEVAGSRNDADTKKQTPGQRAAEVSLDRPTIAVLPFTNMSSEGEQDYFADGITEDLITDISKISDIDVIARFSTLSYTGQTTDVRDVGRDLGASHVVEGSVRKSGDRIRITIQLADAMDGKHVWAERYDRKLRDVFDIQDELVSEIIIALALKLTPEEESFVVSRSTDNIDAYDFYMRGRQQESYFTKESNFEAQRYYEQALALDADYSEALAHLAQIHTMRGQFGWIDDIEAADRRALELIQRAIAIDPTIPFNRFSYSRILARNSIGRYDQAIGEAKKTIELAPNYADAHAYLGQLYILTGHAEKALGPIATAMRINPIFPFWYNYTDGFARFFLGDYDTALENLGKAVEQNPNVYFARTAYASALAHAGRQEDAEWQVFELENLGFDKSLDEFIGESPVRDPEYRARYRAGLARAGLE